MKTLLYICSAISTIIGLYELTWLGKSNLALVIIPLAFILAINSYVLASKIDKWILFGFYYQLSFSIYFIGIFWAL